MIVAQRGCAIGRGLAVLVERGATPDDVAYVAEQADHAPIREARVLLARLSIPVTAWTINQHRRRNTDAAYACTCPPTTKDNQ